MKKGTKISLIVAGILLVLGLILCAIVIGTGDLENLKADDGMEMKSTTIQQEFRTIRVHTAEADIRLMRAEDGVCRVEYPVDKYSNYIISTENGVLMVQYETNRKWYDWISFGLAFKKREVRVYLPSEQYDALLLTSASGDIAVDLGVEYVSAKVTSVSGDIAFHANVKADCDLQSTSGDVLLHNVRSTGNVEVQSTSGKCTATDITCQNFLAKSASGDLVLGSIMANEFVADTLSGEMTLAGCVGQTLSMESTSGDIEFTRCEGEKINITTVSGDVEGSFKSGKTFECHTTSGDITTPPSVADAGKCTIKTTSGDVEIDIR